MSLWEVAYAIEDGFSWIMSYNVGYMFICDIIKPLYIYEGSLCSAALSRRSFFKSFKQYACSVSGAMPRIITQFLLIA